MGYALQFNCLLSVSAGQLDLNAIKAGQHYTVIKEGERLYPINIPIELCDDSHRYYGKVVVRRLTLETNKTTLEIEVLKRFDINEAAVYSANFIAPQTINAPPN